jgi:hypothetical protein
VYLRPHSRANKRRHGITRIDRLTTGDIQCP